MRHFQIFNLPRPWWGWMRRIVPEERPTDPAWMMAVCTALLALGSSVLAKSLRASPLDLGHDCRSLKVPVVDPGAPVAPQ
jgi:hypothetical protein